MSHKLSPPPWRWPKSGQESWRIWSQFFFFLLSLKSFLNECKGILMSKKYFFAHRIFLSRLVKIEFFTFFQTTRKKTKKKTKTNLHPILVGVLVDPKGPITHETFPITRRTKIKTRKKESGFFSKKRLTSPFFRFCNKTHILPVFCQETPVKRVF